MAKDPRYQSELLSEPGDQAGAVAASRLYLSRPDAGERNSIRAPSGGELTRVVHSTE
jgi:hypothetical protein